MHRLIGLLAALILVLGIGVSATVAAEPSYPADRVLVSVNGTADVAAGDDLDALVVVGGSATVRGDVQDLVIVGGSATLSGATAERLTVIDGSATLAGGSTVLGDVRTLGGTVTQDPGSTVQGSVQRLDADLAAVGILLIPMFILLFIGFGLAAIVAGLVVAAFGARQVRVAESLITREPGQVLVAGLIGMVVLPLVSVLVMMTIVGAPVGFAMLFILLPLIAFAGWIVAAIWIGDWILGRLRGTAETGRPYRAALVGVIALAFAGIVPFVSAIATLFGFGALLLMAWRTIRPPTPAVGDAPSTQPTPSAA
jgi:hypothetical protein